MGNVSFVASIQEYFSAVEKALWQIDKQELEQAMNALMDCYERGSAIYCFGNGGSASTASHMANDFNKGISCSLEKKFRFFCLSDNVATLTAIANDISYEDIYAVQIENKLLPGDLIVAISGSGNSPNIIKAVRYAKDCGCKVIGLSGFQGGMLKKLADYSMHVPSDSMQVVEDIHIVFNHMMMKIFSDMLRN